MNILMLVVLVCVPLMLCVKPCYLNCTKASPKVEEDEFVKTAEETPKYATHEDGFLEATQQGNVLRAADDAFDLHERIVDSFVDPTKHVGEENFLEIMIH